VCENAIARCIKFSFYISCVYFQRFTRFENNAKILEVCDPSKLLRVWFIVLQPAYKTTDIYVN